MTYLIRGFMEMYSNKFLKITKSYFESRSPLLSVENIVVDEDLINQCVHRIDALFEMDNFSTLLTLYDISDKLHQLKMRYKLRYMNRNISCKLPRYGVSDNVIFCTNGTKYYDPHNYELGDRILIENYFDLIDQWNHKILNCSIDIFSTETLHDFSFASGIPKYGRKCPNMKAESDRTRLLKRIFYPFLTGYFYSHRRDIDCPEFDIDLTKIFQLNNMHCLGYSTHDGKFSKFVLELISLYYAWSAEREEASSKIQTWWRSVSYFRGGITYQQTLAEASQK